MSGLGCSNVSTPNLRAGHVSQSKTSSLRTVLVLTMRDPRGWGPARRRSAESPQSKKAAPTLPQERGARWAATVGRLPKHLLPRRLRRPHGLRTPKLPARSCGPAPPNCPPARLCRVDPGSREDLLPTTLVVRMCSITGRRPQAAGLRSAPSGGEERGGDSHQQELPQAASVSQPAGGGHCAGVVRERRRLETLPQTPTTEGILAESRASPTELGAGRGAPSADRTAPSPVEDWHCRGRPG